METGCIGSAGNGQELISLDERIKTFDSCIPKISRVYRADLKPCGVSLRDWTLILLYSVLAAVSGCVPVTSTEAPSGWVRIDTSGFFFYVPPDFEPVDVQGVDSIVGKYQGNSISLGFDYGSYSDPLHDSDQPNYTVQHERIDGRKARIVSYRNPESAHPYDFSTGIHFADAGGNGARLTLLATCKTRADLETARTIFRTIHFE